MHELLDQLNKTVIDLENHPWIEVTEKKIGPPATNSAISSMQMVAMLKLPEDVKSFYLAANGFSCKWHIRANLDNAAMQLIKEHEEEHEYDYGKPLGQISILPYERVLISDWQPPKENDPGAMNKFEYRSEEFTYARFGKNLKPFDEYHPAGIQCMAFFIQDGNAKVMMLDDYNADWQNSRISDFATYIRLMCDTRFTVPSRDRIYRKYRGDKLPDLEYSQMNDSGIIPRLFQVSP